MSRSLRLVLIGLVALALVGGVVGYIMWNQPHRDLSAGKADFTMKPEELLQAFTANEAEANTKYLNKVVELSGVILDKPPIDGGGAVVLLEVPGEMLSVINCAFEATDAASVQPLDKGATITVRGEVTGYTMDVNLARCVLVQ